MNRTVTLVDLGEALLQSVPHHGRAQRPRVIAGRGLGLPRG